MSSLRLDFPNPALFGRENTEHTIKHIASGAFDEVVSYNPQSGSQWDGFRHVSEHICGFKYDLPNDSLMAYESSLIQEHFYFIIR
jgi:hypothetical protein